MTCFTTAASCCLWPRNTDFPEELEVISAIPLSTKRESVKVPVIPFTEGFFKVQVEKLRTLDPPVKTVAAIGIGQLGYFANEMYILDLVGLTNRHIAKSVIQVAGTLVIPGHQKQDANYVLSRQPDVIYIPKAIGAVLDPKQEGLAPELGDATFLPTVVSIQRDPRFAKEYLWDEQIQAYVRRVELRRMP